MKIFLTLLVASLAAGTAWAQGNVNPSDMAQARVFVASLPPACGSNVGTQSDGTVSVSFSCVNKAGQAVTGTVFVKDGKVTKMN
jgi:hypothetical protein